MKTKLTIGLILLLLLVAGCGVVLTDFSDESAIKCNDVCLNEGLTTNTITSNTEIIYCHCERVIKI